MKEVHQKLNQFYATAICGNDILSSVLYVSGIAIMFSGVYAPLVLLAIILVLFFYKSVYTEVVETLPINGGAYNCLLNGTSKTFAAIAGVMTILSYVATAVISAKVAIEYVHTVLPIPVIPATIALLLFFAVLVISGIKDSAKVALGIFIIHALSLVGFLILGAAYFLSGHTLFLNNFAATSSIIQKNGGIMIAFYLAFSASLLGVSGFESSANFVEEQEAGVFRKTLRNMLIAVGVFNPLVALAVLNSMPFEMIIKSKDFLLADAAHVIGGPIFQYLIVTDAFLVLSGAVLTGYVGVSGLIHRMAADSCLPNFLTKQNSKGSFPRIIVGFFLLCTSILLVTGGDILSLAGVYTIAFLGVMSLFAFGNLILRETRTDLKRSYKAPLPFVMLALLATVLGVLGNIRIDSNNLKFFEVYFIPSFIIVMMVIHEDWVIKIAVRLTTPFPKIQKYFKEKFEDVTEGKFIAFIHHPSRLHTILNYIDRNETGWNIILIHCKDKEGHTYDKSFEEIKELVPTLQKGGVHPHLSIKVVYIEEPFSPEIIDKVSKQYNVRKNRIMIGSIHAHHPYDYEELGGVRIIL